MTLNHEWIRSSLSIDLSLSLSLSLDWLLTVYETKWAFTEEKPRTTQAALAADAAIYLILYSGRACMLCYVMYVIILVRAMCYVSFVLNTV